MKSVMILASAGIAAAQLTADIAAISSGVVQLNSQVQAFTALPQASAIVDTSNTIVSAIEKGTSDVTSGGSIPDSEAVNLVGPFSSLNGAVQTAIDALVSKKALATSLSIGNVVEAQLAQQLSAAQAFASAVVAEVPTELQAIASGLAASIIQNLSSGSAAFSGLSGPSTLGGAAPTSAASTPASTPAASTGSSAAVSSAASTGSVSSAAVSSAASTAAASSSAAASNGTAPSTSPITPSTGGAEKALVGFAGAAVAAFVAMIAL